MTVLASRRHHQMLTELGAADVIDNREEPEAVSAVSQVKYRRITSAVVAHLRGAGGHGAGRGRPGCGDH